MRDGEVEKCDWMLIGGGIEVRLMRKTNGSRATRKMHGWKPITNLDENRQVVVQAKAGDRASGGRQRVDVEHVTL